MKSFVYACCVMMLASVYLVAADKSDTNDEGSKNLHQYYSGKVGFYQPGDGLNNGLFLGIDGITEFTHYNFFLSGAVDFYMKQTFDFYENPKPEIQQQQIFLLPLHINFGYKIFDIEDADCHGYIGAGGGYYFYFYSADYRTTSGGIVPTFTSQSDTKNSGNVFGTIFARVLLGKIFVEPRFYLASKSEENFAGSRFVVNPSGFAITIGFQQ